jgi:hypothetical protein
MYQHPRPSPWSASAANNLQTNPTRTNNQRDPMSERSSPQSDFTPYSDRGTDDSGEMVGRADQVSEAEHRHNQKVNQVIQVRVVTQGCEAPCTDPCPELLHQSSPHHRFVPNNTAPELQQRRKPET